MYLALLLSKVDKLNLWTHEKGVSILQLYYPAFKIYENNNLNFISTVRFVSTLALSSVKK